MTWAVPVLPADSYSASRKAVRAVPLRVTSVIARCTSFRFWDETRIGLPSGASPLSGMTEPTWVTRCGRCATASLASVAVACASCRMVKAL